MSGKEKLYFLLNRIDDARAIAPSGQPLLIDPTNDLNRNYRGVELDQLFTKLIKDEKVLKVLQNPNRVRNAILQEYGQYRDMDDGCYHIELLPAFVEYFAKIQSEPEYQEFSGRKPAQQLPIQANKNEKPNRKALEKIWNVLQEIEEKRLLAADGDEIQIPKYPYDNEVSSDWDSYYQERKAILPKLASLGATKGIREGEEGAWQFWGFNLGDKYSEVFGNYERQYKEAAEAYKQTKPITDVDLTNPVYEVRYSEQTREILINNFLVKKLRSFSDNDVIFAYLYKNPNQEQSDADIKKGTGLDSIKDLNKFLDDVGFTGELRRVFFKVSKNKIRFNNPISKEYLKEIELDRLKLG